MVTAGVDHDHVAFEIREVEDPEADLDELGIAHGGPVVEGDRPRGVAHEGREVPRKLCPCATAQP